MTMLAGLEVLGLSHAFSGRPVVRDVSLTIARGEIVCLLGPSGCGKSTTLRVIAGLESLQAGEVRYGGVVWARPGIQWPPERRHVGLVFQDFALFPHLSILDNVAFGLDGRKSDRQARAHGYLKRVGLDHYAHSYPHQLSGGEQQRVALARALAPQPSVMLLDEPFSGLDTRLRDRVRDETLSLLKAEGVATLLVTHDPEEAMRMADRIILMRDGRIEQQGQPDQLYHEPTSLFAARFLGEGNCIEARAEGGRLRTILGEFSAPTDGPYALFIRPEDLRLAPLGEGAPVEVTQSRSLGPFALIETRDAQGQVWTVRQTAGARPSPGARLGLVLDGRAPHIFPVASA